MPQYEIPQGPAVAPSSRWIARRLPCAPPNLLGAFTAKCAVVGLEPPQVAVAAKFSNIAAGPRCSKDARRSSSNLVHIWILRRRICRGHPPRAIRGGEAGPAYNERAGYELTYMVAPTADAAEARS